jgi:hypothetical protein
MSTILQQRPASLGIQVRFTPSVFFIVGVLAGSRSGRPARRLGKDNFPAPLWGRAPEGGQSPTNFGRSVRGNNIRKPIMYNTTIKLASRPRNRAVRVINIPALSATLALFLPGLAFAAPAANLQYAGPTLSVAVGSINNAPSQVAQTNGITARIKTDLDAVKAKIDTAIKALQQAVASNQDQRAVAVSNVAAQVRAVAQSDLGDSSALVKETDRLIQKMKDSISHGRMLSADPKEEAREAYAQGLLTLEPELSELINRRTSVARVRAELLRQAGALESRARAIGWLEDADQMKAASKALEDALEEALAFAGRIDAVITQLGRGQPVAIE